VRFQLSPRITYFLPARLTTAAFHIEVICGAMENSSRQSWIVSPVLFVTVTSPWKPAFQSDVTLSAASFEAAEAETEERRSAPSKRRSILERLAVATRRTGIQENRFMTFERLTRKTSKNLATARHGSYRWERSFLLRKSTYLKHASRSDSPQSFTEQHDCDGQSPIAPPRRWRAAERMAPERER
jgi:hypothetical protein